MRTLSKIILVFFILTVACKAETCIKSSIDQYQSIDAPNLEMEFLEGGFILMEYTNTLYENTFVSLRVNNVSSNNFHLLGDACEFTHLSTNALWVENTFVEGGKCKHRISARIPFEKFKRCNHFRDIQKLNGYDFDVFRGHFEAKIESMLRIKKGEDTVLRKRETYASTAYALKLQKQVLIGKSFKITTVAGEFIGYINTQEYDISSGKLMVSFQTEHSLGSQYSLEAAGISIKSGLFSQIKSASCEESDPSCQGWKLEITPQVGQCTFQNETAAIRWKILCGNCPSHGSVEEIELVIHQSDFCVIFESKFGLKGDLELYLDQGRTEIVDEITTEKELFISAHLESKFGKITRSKVVELYICPYNDNGCQHSEDQLLLVNNYAVTNKGVLFGVKHQQIDTQVPTPSLKFSHNLNLDLVYGEYGLTTKHLGILLFEMKMEVSYDDAQKKVFKVRLQHEKSEKESEPRDLKRIFRYGTSPGISSASAIGNGTILVLSCFAMFLFFSF